MKKMLNMLLPNVQQNRSTAALLVFVLLFFAGSGRFSVDGWFAKKKCLKDTKVWVKGDTKHRSCPVLDKQKRRLSQQSQLTLSRKFITLTPQITVNIN